MKIYKLKPGFTGMEKFITEEAYEKCSYFERNSCYQETRIKQCAAHARDSDSNLDKEEQDRIDAIQAEEDYIQSRYPRAIGYENLQFYD